MRPYWAAANIAKKYGIEEKPVAVVIKQIVVYLCNN
jgi:hypothetical protein